MKVKIIVAILMLSSGLVSNTTSAQSKQNAEKEFLKQLNNILLNSKQQHWKFTGPMTVDSAFAINTNGILSATVHYTDDDSTIVITRMEAPVKNILRVGYDLYLILEYQDDQVTVFESEPNSKELKETYKTNLFHIGVPPTDSYKQQEKLQQLLDKLLKL